MMSHQTLSELHLLNLKKLLTYYTFSTYYYIDQIYSKDFYQRTRAQTKDWLHPEVQMLKTCQNQYSMKIGHRMLLLVEHNSVVKTT